MSDEQLWTFVWVTDDGPELGPVCTSSEAAMDAAFEEWVEYQGGTLGGFDEGTREEFDAMYEESPDVWVRPLGPGWRGSA